MILNEYNTLIRENFDISDSNTRKCIVALEDAEQNQVLSALSSALYDKIVQKVDKIDFSTIPRSRGDITKVDGFDNTVECLTIMRNLVLEYKQDPKVVDTVITAIENTKTRKGIFMKAYALNIELPMVMYNLNVFAIEQSVSFLIATCIQYIKDPATDSITTAFDKVSYNNARDNLIYEQLELFNSACLSKELDDVLNNIIKTGGRISEGVTGLNDVGAGINSIIINVGKGAAGGEYNSSDSPFKKFDDDSDCKSDDSCSKTDCASEPEVSINGSCNNLNEGVTGLNDVGAGVNNIIINVGKRAGGCGSESSESDDNSNSINDYDDAEVIPNEQPVEEFSGMALGAIAAGSIIAVGLGIKGLFCLIKVIIPYMRNIAYYAIHYRVKLSDSLAIQSQFIEANAYKLMYSTNSNLTEEKKKKVVEKQLKWAERLKNWSNKIAIDSKKAKKDAQQMINDESKKMKIDDIKDELPPDILDKGGIF